MGSPTLLQVNAVPSHAQRTRIAAAPKLQLPTASHVAPAMGSAIGQVSMGGGGAMHTQTVLPAPAQRQLSPFGYVQARLPAPAPVGRVQVPPFMGSVAGHAWQVKVVIPPPPGHRHTSSE
jgi:S-formylglutathione hydrolase FrmB